MPMFKVGDVVTLLADVPGDGLRKGQVGTVVHEFTEPGLAYETEFADADGRTVAQLALRPGQIRHRTRATVAAPAPARPSRRRERNVRA